MKSTYRHCPHCGAGPLIDAPHGGLNRRSCADPACGFVFWDNPTPVVAAIVERNDNVVLVRSLGWPESWFGLVTGFLERGETPEEAALREVKEELGLDGELRQLIGVYAFRRMNQVIIAYHVEAHGGEIVLDETELAAHKEVPLAKVRPWRAGTGHALMAFLQSRGLSPAYL